MNSPDWMQTYTGSGAEKTTATPAAVPRSKSLGVTGLSVKKATPAAGPEAGEVPNMPHDRHRAIIEHRSQFESNPMDKITKRFPVRVNPYQEEVFAAAAEQMDISAAAFLRMAGLEYARKMGIF